MYLSWKNLARGYLVQLSSIYSKNLMKTKLFKSLIYLRQQTSSSYLSPLTGDNLNLDK